MMQRRFSLVVCFSYLYRKKFAKNVIVLIKALFNKKLRRRIMMKDDRIYIIPEDSDVKESSDYAEFPSTLFSGLPEVAKSLLKDATVVFSKIEKLLYVTPTIINLVRAAIPEVTLQAVLTDDQKEQLAKGALKLMAKKDGSLMAMLTNPKTKKIVASVPLKAVDMAPELAQAMTSFASQMQMAQIAEQIQSVQFAIEEVRKGQEEDRLAIAHSCQQKLLQARTIKNPELKSRVLLQVISDAEDSRNLLMLSQRTNMSFIRNQPESTFGKLFKGEKAEKIENRINEIRDSLNAVNLVSLSEAMAYCELDEQDAAKKSLAYFAEFIDETYLSTPGLVERLDLIDPSPKNYWSKTLPKIEKSIVSLPSYPELQGGTKQNEEQK